MRQAFIFLDVQNNKKMPLFVGKNKKYKSFTYEISIDSNYFRIFRNEFYTCSSENKSGNYGLKTGVEPQFSEQCKMGSAFV